MTDARTRQQMLDRIASYRQIIPAAHGFTEADLEKLHGGQLIDMAAAHMCAIEDIKTNLWQGNELEDLWPFELDEAAETFLETLPHENSSVENLLIAASLLLAEAERRSAMPSPRRGEGEGEGTPPAHPAADGKDAIHG